jgi:hypothetical protein
MYVRAENPDFSIAKDGQLEATENMNASNYSLASLVDIPWHRCGTEVFALVCPAAWHWSLGRS